MPKRTTISVFAVEAEAARDFIRRERIGRLGDLLPIAINLYQTATPEQRDAARRRSTLDEARTKRRRPNPAAMEN